MLEQAVGSLVGVTSPHHLAQSSYPNRSNLIASFRDGWFTSVATRPGPGIMLATLAFICRLLKPLAPSLCSSFNGARHPCAAVLVNSCTPSYANLVMKLWSSWEELEKLITQTYPVQSRTLFLIQHPICIPSCLAGGCKGTPTLAAHHCQLTAWLPDSCITCNTLPRSFTSA